MNSDNSTKIQNGNSNYQYPKDNGMNSEEQKDTTTNTQETETKLETAPVIPKKKKKKNKKKKNKENKENKDNGKSKENNDTNDKIDIDIKIEKVSDKHTDQIYKLNQEIFKDEVLYERDFIDQYCKSAEGFIASVNGNIVGYVLYGNSFTYEILKETFTIISIGVNKKFRGIGVGGKLINTLCRAFSDRDIYLHVRVKNDAANRFYKNHGFENVSVSHNYYDLIKDGREDANLMVKKSLKLALKSLLKGKKNVRNGGI